MSVVKTDWTRKERCSLEGAIYKIDMTDNIQEENSLGHIHGFFKNKKLLEERREATGMDSIEEESLKSCDGRDAFLCMKDRKLPASICVQL